jgi:glycosyltransferase involved in cell wall biosynthesis
VRIFIGLAEVASYYANLEVGFSRLGVRCVFADLSAHRFKYRRDIRPGPLIGLLEYCAERQYADHYPARRAVWLMLRRVLQCILLFWAILTCDAFIFGYQSSFLKYHDLPILKLLRKRIIYVFHGSDCRPPYLDGYTMAEVRGVSTARCLALTKQQKDVVRRIERYADVVICPALTGHFFERPYVAFENIGNPQGTACRSGSTPAGRDLGKVRVLHSPSDPEGKGTRYIREAVDRLRRRGYPIEFVTVTGRPHAAVLDELARCDFVIDQVFSDTFMAVFPTEAATFGKPAVIAGYGHLALREMMRAKVIPPAVYSHPSQVQQAIERLVVDVEFRLWLGKQAREFVRARWAAEKVARRYLRLIAGEFPAEWLWEPGKLTYVHGYGLAEQRAQAGLRALIEAGGPAALMVADKPDLQRRLVDFAYARNGRAGSLDPGAPRGDGSAHGG